MAFCLISATEILQHAFGESPWTLTVVGPKVHLWIGDPGVSLVGGAEVSGGGYVAQQTIPGDWQVLNPTLNTAAITFPEATAYWGIVTHVVLTTTIDIEGYPLMYGALVSEKEIDTGSIARFNIGALAVTLT